MIYGIELLKELKASGIDIRASKEVATGKTQEQEFEYEKLVVAPIEDLPVLTAFLNTNLHSGAYGRALTQKRTELKGSGKGSTKKVLFNETAEVEI